MQFHCYNGNALKTVFSASNSNFRLRTKKTQIFAFVVPDDPYEQQRVTQKDGGHDLHYERERGRDDDIPKSNDTS